jgi:hypothetical protein
MAEIKYGFKTTGALLSTVLGKGESSAVNLATSNFLERMGMEVFYPTLNFFPGSREVLSLGLFLLIVLALVKFKSHRQQFLLILIWIVSNLFLDLFGPPQLYYVGIGLAIPVIFIFSFYLSRLFSARPIIAGGLIALILVLNLGLMKKYNPQGPVMDLYVQRGMLLSDQKKVIDLIYQEAKGKKFTVNALTMPYKIKTTWAYLFNWHGKQKYGYLPFWGGEDVPGFAGALPASDSRDYVRFAIYEPNRGIPEELRQEFTDSENGYSLPLLKKEVGLFVIEKRRP